MLTVPDGVAGSNSSPGQNYIKDALQSLASSVCSV